MRYPQLPSSGSKIFLNKFFSRTCNLNILGILRFISILYRLYCSGVHDYCFLRKWCVVSSVLFVAEVVCGEFSTVCCGSGVW